MKAPEVVPHSDNLSKHTTRLSNDFRKFVTRPILLALLLISGRPVVTEVKQAQVFWPAEEVHQRFLEKGGNYGRPQSADTGAVEEIRCYG